MCSKAHLRHSKWQMGHCGHLRCSTEMGKCCSNLTGIWDWAGQEGGKRKTFWGVGRRVGPVYYRLAWGRGAGSSNWKRGT